MKSLCPTLASLRHEQPQAIDRLIRLGTSARRPHALIFSGCAATQPHLVARAWVRAVACSKQGQSFDACGRCESCNSGSSLTSPRIFTLAKEDGPAGVDEVRAVQAQLGLRVAEGLYKVVFVPDACRLRAQAQNALLKVLEEPPPKTVFVLVAQRFAALLPTVRSRAMRIQLAMPKSSSVFETLTQNGINAELVDWLLPFVGSDVERAKSFVDAGLSELISDLQRHLTLGLPSAQTAKFAQKYQQNRFLAPFVLGFVELLIRDALADKLGARLSLSPEAQARAQWVEADSTQLAQALALIESSRNFEAYNPNRSLLLETTLLTLNRRDTAL